MAITDIEDPDTVAVSGAACGADLLFCHAWLATDRRLEVFLPRDPEAFLDESVRFAGPEWEARFHRVVDHPKTEVVGAPPDLIRMENPHTANNLRILERARLGTLPLRGIFVWDGSGGDGPGGTRHMVSEVEDAGGEVLLIEP